MSVEIPRRACPIDSLGTIPYDNVRIKPIEARKTRRIIERHLNDDEAASMLEMLGLTPPRPREA